jgi:hypothetical protein
MAQAVDYPLLAAPTQTPRRYIPGVIAELVLWSLLAALILVAGFRTGFFRLLPQHPVYTYSAATWLVTNRLMFLGEDDRFSANTQSIFSRLSSLLWAIWACVLIVLALDTILSYDPRDGAAIVVFILLLVIVFLSCGKEEIFGCIHFVQKYRRERIGYELRLIFAVPSSYSRRFS